MEILTRSSASSSHTQWLFLSPPGLTSPVVSFKYLAYSMRYSKQGFFIVFLVKGEGRGIEGTEEEDWLVVSGKDDDDDDDNVMLV